MQEAGEGERESARCAAGDGLSLEDFNGEAGHCGVDRGGESVGSGADDGNLGHTDIMSHLRKGMRLVCGVKGGG